VLFVARDKTLGTPFSISQFPFNVPQTKHHSLTSRFSQCHTSYSGGTFSTLPLAKVAVQNGCPIQATRDSGPRTTSLFIAINFANRSDPSYKKSTPSQLNPKIRIYFLHQQPSAGYSKRCHKVRERGMPRRLSSLPVIL